MTDAATAEADELIDGIISCSLNYQAGSRPVHAPGVAASGWFSATPVASSYSAAALFTGARIPVTVRFSNGTGDLDVSDGSPVVRGMATRFHLDGVSTDQWGVVRSRENCDLIAVSMSVFVAEDEASFRAFLAASVPATPVACPWWRSVTTALQLNTPAPTPPAGTPSAEQHLFEFAQRYPPALPAIAAVASKFIPESYTTCAYHAIHTFGLGGPAGTRWARLHWEPVDGVRGVPTGADGEPLPPAGNFLRGGLAERIRSGHAEFVLRAQLAEAGDPITNLTRAFPTTRPRVVLGQLRLTEVVADQVHGCEQLSFDPTNVVPGIELPHDPILAMRSVVYPLSAARRLAAGGPADTSWP